MSAGTVDALRRPKISLNRFAWAARIPDFDPVWKRRSSPRCLNFCITEPKCNPIRYRIQTYFEVDLKAVRLGVNSVKLPKGPQAMTVRRNRGGVVGNRISKNETTAYDRSFENQPWNLLKGRPAGAQSQEERDMIRALRYLPLLILVFVVGCAGSMRTVENWRDPGFDGPFKRMLVFAPLGGGPNGEIIEDILVSEIERTGIEALPQREVFRYRRDLDRERVVKQIRAKDIDGVLVLKLGYFGPEGRGPATAIHVKGGYGDFDDEISYLISSGTPTNYRAENIEVEIFVDVYDVRSTNKVWTSTILSQNPASSSSLIDNLVNKIVQDLKREKLL